MDHCNDNDIDACNRRLLSDCSKIQGLRNRRYGFEVTIHSVGDLVRVVELCHTGSYQYRGQRRDWGLFPGLTRPGGPVRQKGLEKDEPWREEEKHILTEFRRQAVAYQSLSERDDRSEFETAVLAQYHGADTRLLDWTLNPLAALFFAVRDRFDANDGEQHIEEKGVSVVWAIAQERELELKIYSSLDKLDDQPVFVLPSHTTNRAAVQQSIFALWNDPTKPLDEALGADAAKNMWKIKIPEDRRRHIQWMLHCHGINEATLFPDLDGLGRFSAWKHQKVWEEEYKKQGKPAPKP